MPGPEHEVAGGPIALAPPAGRIKLLYFAFCKALYC